MKYAALFLGISLLLFGCLDYFRFEQAGPPVQAGETQGGGAAPSGRLTCADGTPVNSCSSAKPNFCTASQALEPNPPLCGCPAGAILQNDSCVSQCQDGTSLERCSRTKPKFCNQYGQLVDKASMCGCPELSVRSGEICAPACPDGTLPGGCSETKPNYCSESLTLVSNPSECGCPDGQVFQDGRCKAAKCIDGTPVGSCSSSMLPMYCGESLTLVRNPRVCGCLDTEILSEDSSQCLNPSSMEYEEGDKFKIFDDAYMRVSEAEWIECTTGDYIRLQLQIDNSEGDTAYPLDQFDVGLLGITGPEYYDRDWIPVQFPSHDGMCVEDDKFAWTYTFAGDINTGMVWFYLDGGYDSDADYYFYYREMMVELDP